MDQSHLVAGEAPRDVAAASSVELSSLVEEIEAHLQRYLRRSMDEYPAGSQADWVASSVVDRIMASGGEADFKALAKLCVFLVESLGDISKTYEEFYSEQLESLRDEAASMQTQLTAIEDENGRLREQLHHQAEELKIRDLSLRSLRLQQRSSARPSNKDSLSSSCSAGHSRAKSTDGQVLLVSSLQDVVTEKMKAIETLEKQLHVEKMKNREFDEKVSLPDEDDEDGEEGDGAEGEDTDDGDVNDADFDDPNDYLGSSAGNASFGGGGAGFNRELIKENADLQARLQELLRENSQFRQLSAQLTADNQQLRTATRELRSTVERLHKKLHSDELLGSQASQIFEELLRDNSHLGGLSGDDATVAAGKAAADARAADETFEIDGEEEEIPDEPAAPDAVGDDSSRPRECRHCAKLREALAKLEQRHEEEAARIREIVTQNVCMKCELEDWKSDMAEKVRQNVALNGQLESCQRLLNRLSPGNAAKARTVFGNVLISGK